MHPVIGHLGPLEIYSYGLMLALGVTLGLALAVREARRKGIDPELVSLFAIYAIPAGLVGARLLYVVLEWQDYAAEPWRVFRLQEGGLSVHGAILAGAAVAAWFTRRRQLGWGSFADLFAPSLALGIGITRIGCFLNGCCYGISTGGGWGTLTRYAPGLRHPAQLYEMGLDLALFAWLWGMRGRTRYEGQLILSFAALYSLVRFVLDFYRDVPRLAGSFSVTQVASLLLAGAAWAYHRARSARLARSRGG